MQKAQKIVLMVRGTLIALGRALAWLPPLAARISVGLVFFESGWGKLQNLPRVAEFFGSLGIPAPSFHAHLVATVEFICGGLLIVGLFTPAAAIPLAITMVVALLTAKQKEFNGLSELFTVYEYLYVLLLGWLIVSGPGAVSLDRHFLRKLEKTRSR